MRIVHRTSHHIVSLLYGTRLSAGLEEEQTSVVRKGAQGLDWKRVMWSDESCFQLHYADGNVRIWRKQNGFGECFLGIA
ncbi:hypothetical protein TNCV_426291 [Trichonephila clavipes]|nr:hypothetical protein TNCV_426291 [Trichonephila clavipes]